ncbi:MAG TPA: benzoyl-CoA 2,3-epoxidase subunit BoxB, partial [Myxococcales bacterium]|nr:benzoyl-CoA 2,3-epoxidase subunit BoxB [Myxococcales bacterium]
EISTNAASFFGAGLKGRAREEKFEDHVALQGTYPMEVFEAGAFKHQDVPLRSAMNEVLRDGYVEDCQRGVDRWNKVLAEAGLDFRFALPSRRFHRQQGIFSASRFDPAGKPLPAEAWEKGKDAWLPSAADRAYVKGLQARPVYRPGEMASWIAPPPRGIDGKPLDFVYVRPEGGK